MSAAGIAQGPGSLFTIPTGTTIIESYWSNCAGTDAAGGPRQLLELYTPPDESVILYQIRKLEQVSGTVSVIHPPVPWPSGAVIDVFGKWGGTGTYHVRFYSPTTGVTTDHTPVAMPEPDGAPPALTTRVYDTIADLGAELDRQEAKLDFLESGMRFLARGIAASPAAAEDAVPVVADEEIDITNALGVIVTIAGVPASVSEDFGVPVHLHRAGRVTLGTEAGWLPSYELTHSPFVVMPLPVGVTRSQVTVRPPMTATLAIIPKAK